MKTTPEQRDKILVKAINTWGGQLQMLIAIEEMAELTKALVKHQRNSSVDTYYDVNREIADVQIMLWQLSLMFHQPDIQAEIQTKMERLAERLEGL